MCGKGQTAALLIIGGANLVAIIIIADPGAALLWCSRACNDRTTCRADHAASESSANPPASRPANHRPGHAAQQGTVDGPFILGISATAKRQTRKDGS